MRRNLHPDTVAAIESGNFEFATLLQIEFPTVIRLTNFGQAISAFGESFVDTGHLLGVDEIVETAKLSTSEIDIELSGVDRAYNAIFITNNHIGVKVRVWRAIMLNGVVQGDPMVLFDGSITDYNSSEDAVSGESTITVAVSGMFSDFRKRNGMRTTTQSQRRVFPDDLGMQYASGTDKKLFWGT